MFDKIITGKHVNTNHSSWLLDELEYWIDFHFEESLIVLVIIACICILFLSGS